VIKPTNNELIDISSARDLSSRRKLTSVKDEYEMYIGGDWVGSSDGAKSRSVDPTTGEQLALVPVATADDVDLAASAAKSGAELWKRFGWQERARILMEIANRLESRSREFALLDAIDGGIPVSGMRKDVQNAVAFLRYFAGLSSELKGTTIEAPQNGLNFSLREPFGVVGRIVPFNHPLQFAAAAIAGPLAAGNAVILKPSDVTPISALHLAALAADLLPAGVLNVITGGAATGAALVAHPGVPRIGFTGSVQSGRAVVKSSADHLKTVSLELGGKNPLIIFPDVDITRAAAATVEAMNFHRGQGQSCGAPSRVLVHSSIREQFVAQLVTMVEDFNVGDPLLAETDMGPLAFQSHYERVLDYIAVGRDEGAQVVTGGDSPVGRSCGYFLAPTILDSVERWMRVAREEIFGPVISVLSWNEEKVALEIANELPLGLTANVWTNNLSKAIHFSRNLEAGYVWVNGRGQRPLGAPFGGYKYSGLGSENSIEELLSFTRIKNINISSLDTEEN